MADKLEREATYAPVTSAIKGRENVKRAMEIAAAGGHNLLGSVNEGVGPRKMTPPVLTMAL